MSIIVSVFHKLLDTATNSYRQDIDWCSILDITDLIRRKDVSAEVAVEAIIKKISRRNNNPRTSYYGLVVLESCVKNCGSPIHDEIGTKLFMDQFFSFITGCKHEEAKTKALDLIQSWAFAFRSIPKYRAVTDCANKLKAMCYTFPAFNETDAVFIADDAPTLVDGNVCHFCQFQLKGLNQKYHCRSCGHVFCYDCSSYKSSVPKYGIEQPVRVCGKCYVENKPKVPLPPMNIVPTVIPGPSNAQQPRNSNERIFDIDNETFIAYISSAAVVTSKKDFTSSNLNINTGPLPSIIKKQKARPTLQRCKSTPPVSALQSECDICLDAEKKVAFLCGHRACSRCAKKLTHCHICRKVITHKITLY